MRIFHNVTEADRRLWKAPLVSQLFPFLWAEPHHADVSLFCEDRSWQNDFSNSRSRITAWVARFLLERSWRTVPVARYLTNVSVCFMLCVIFKHTAIVVGAMSLFTFSGPLIYMMTWDNMSTQSWRVLTYLKINPMYYWMNTCSYNMINNLEINILIYFVGTVIITFLVSALILRKQEIR